MTIWKRRQRNAKIKEVLDETLKKHPGETIMTKEMVNEISQKIAEMLYDDMIDFDL